METKALRFLWVIVAVGAFVWRCGGGATEATVGDSGGTGVRDVGTITDASGHDAGDLDGGGGDATGADAGVDAGGDAAMALGIYRPGDGAMDTYTQQVGRTPAFAWTPMSWKDFDTGTYQEFSVVSIRFDGARARGIMPGLTWDASKGSVESYANHQEGINQTDFSWAAITSGTHDAYITRFAQAAAAYHYPFLLRTLHEMDGTWYPWGYGVNGNNNPSDFVTAWTHIVDIFRKENAANVQFVWCPSALSPDLIQKYGDALKQAYPGDGYVDWVALDGYSNPQNGWRSLQGEFQPSYDLITGFSARPMILFEVGSMENPDDPMAKANWITQGFLTTIPSQLPKVRVAVWFDSKDGSGRDYTLRTSPNAFAAWKQVVASPLYQGSVMP